MSKPMWNAPPNWPPPPPGWTPPAGWQPDRAWGPPPPGWQFTPPRKPRGKRIAGLLLAGAVLLIVVVSAAGSGSDSGGASSSPASSALPAPANESGGALADQTRGAAKWIDTTSKDTHAVQIAAQAVQGGFKLLAGGATDLASLAAFSQLVKQSHDFCHDAELNLVTEIDDPLQSQRSQAWHAAEEFSGAYSSLRSYVDSQKPSDLADYQTKDAEATRDWNEAVKAIWTAAGRTSPPTV